MERLSLAWLAWTEAPPGRRDMLAGHGRRRPVQIDTVQIDAVQIDAVEIDAIASPLRDASFPDGFRAAGGDE